MLINTYNSCLKLKFIHKAIKWKFINNTKATATTASLKLMPLIYTKTIKLYISNLAYVEFVTEVEVISCILATANNKPIILTASNTTSRNA